MALKLRIERGLREISRIFICELQDLTTNISVAEIWPTQVLEASHIGECIFHVPSTMSDNQAVGLY